MENIQQEPPDISTPATYRIGVFGALGDEWIEVLNGMGVDHTLADGQVLIFTLQGELADQAALLGILNFLYNHRLLLLSVECLNCGVNLPSIDAPDPKQLDGGS